MAKRGRNDLCPCGSRRKVKRCCGVLSGPSGQDRATARLAGLTRQMAPLVADWDEADFVSALDAAWRLPERFTALQAPLPRLWGPALKRLGDVVAAGESPTRAEVDGLAAVVDELDTPQLRLQLAETALELAEDGELELELAAVLVLDMRGTNRTVLAARVLQAVAVACGRKRTPSGLVVATG